MTVSELLTRISSHELTEWIAYAEIDPFGEWRSDLRAGIVASTVANTARDPKRRHKAYAAADFMPTFERKEQSWEDQLSYVEMLNRAFGGRDLRKR